MKVALTVTCINDAMFPDTGMAVVTLLRRPGVEVGFPEQQTCCAQPLVNTGYLDEAVPVLRTFVDAFETYDAVVTPRGRAPVRRGTNTGSWRAAAGTLGWLGGGAVPKTYERSEFLVDVLGVEDVGAYFPHKVTYHPTFHSSRMLGLGERPTRLLKAVRGLQLLDLEGAEQGSGLGAAAGPSSTSLTSGFCGQASPSAGA